ncbi:MAG: WYL domain-containing protein, partial [Paludibacteraceae bacterium]|nr:WYL domain-containing protein [Paludibacteraceae bacterium]
VRIEEYISAHSKTVRTRDLEPFEITDDCKFVWCYDPKDGHCKTFRPSRCKSVTVLNKPWAHAGSFRSEDIDIFGFHGSEPLRVRVRLDIMAYNLLLEEFPEAQRCVSQSADDEWLLDADVYDLRGVGRFCMGLLKHIKITDTPQLKEYLLSEYKSLTE